jgi:hypothetical protein
MGKPDGNRAGFRGAEVCWSGGLMATDIGTFAGGFHRVKAPRCAIIN